MTYIPPYLVQGRQRESEQPPHGVPLGREEDTYNRHLGGAEVLGGVAQERPPLLRVQRLAQVLQESPPQRAHQTDWVRDSTSEQLQSKLLVVFQGQTSDLSIVF